MKAPKCHKLQVARNPRFREFHKKETFEKIEDNSASSDSSIRWGFCFLKGATLLIMLLIVLMPMAVMGQTEIEGEVSGEWTAEDSPYIVIDSTWIPEDEELTLLRGVEVQFTEDQGLYIFGTLEASGTEDDSVRIRVAEDVEHWRGLRFYGRNRTEWNYASIICPDSAFMLDPNSSLTMNNCLVDADRAITGNTGNDGVEGCSLTFSESVIRSKSYHYAVGGTLTANHTLFDFGGDEIDDPGIHTWWTSFRLTSCEVIGVLGAQDGIVYADSCRFLRTPLGKSTGVGIGLGRMTESYVEGGASAGRMYSQTVVTFRNNTLLGSLSLSGTVNVSGCNVGRWLRVSEGESITVRNSTINESLLIRSSNSVTIDSCFFVGDDPQNHYISCHGSDQYHLLSITRSVIRLDRVNIDYRVHTLFDHNTFVFDSAERGAFIGIGQELEMTNNILIANEPGGSIFGGHESKSIDYNCVWGFDYAATGRYEPIPVDVIDSSNVIANPLIVWDDIIPYISFNSPCIDAGDPDSPPDPDSSRSDIGAIVFDHRHNLNDIVNLPGGYKLHDPYPNPFNSKCIIAYDLPVNSAVSMVLYDMSGRSVMVFPTENQGAGYHSFTIGTSDFTSGVYFLKFSANDFQKYSRIVLIR